MTKFKLDESERYKRDIIQSCSDGDLTNKQASISLGLKVRQVQRLKRAFQKDGEQGIVHGLKGKRAHNAVPKKTDENIVTFLKKKNHRDFGPTFAKEKLEVIGIKKSRETIRSLMIKENIWKPHKRRGPQIHRQWRERMTRYGELVQFDGSYHDWFENGKEQCLLAAIDDATSDIVKAIFEDNEGVRAVFRFWRAYVESKGLPIAIYLDRFSTYKINHKNAEDNPEFMTQFERAMKELDIQVICANSPEAKGRVERLFGTLQDRLIKEMRLVDIRSKDLANTFLKKKYIPDHNGRFSVAARETTDAHRPLSDILKTRLTSIFSIRSTRKVNNDFTIQFRNCWFQLSATQNTTVYKNDDVVIEEHLDDTLLFLIKGVPLNYSKLPERPKTLRMKVTALTKEVPQWRPPKDHPWRKFDF